MTFASSPRRQVCAAAVLVLALLAVTAHACASLNAAHGQASFGAHQDAVDHAAETQGWCGEAGLSSAAARRSSTTVRAHVLALDTPAADTAAPTVHMVVAAPAPMLHRRLRLFLLHAVLRV
jgi:hypothetical protein